MDVPPGKEIMARAKKRRIANVTTLPTEWCKRASGTHAHRHPHGTLRLSDLVLVKRIGSASASGIVYLAEVRGGPGQVALKFIPRTYRDTAEREIEIATELGKTGGPFPAVYGSGGAVIALPPGYPQTDAVGREAVRRTVYKMTEGTERQKRLASLRAMKTVESEDFPKVVPAKYMVSELARGDLLQMATPGKYMGGARRALDALHALGYAHNDAHLGNFLVGYDGEVMVHDFGLTGMLTPALADADNEKLEYAYEQYLKGHGAVATMRVMEEA